MMQKMLTRDNWDKFVNNRENRSELVKSITDYHKSKPIREKLKYPLVVTHEEKTWIITSNQVNEDLLRNHIEVSKSKHLVVITVYDTDILALIFYTDQQLSPEIGCLMKIDTER